MEIITLDFPIRFRLYTYLTPHVNNLAVSCNPLDLLSTRWRFLDWYQFRIMIEKVTKETTAIWVRGS